jgi:hypothetical protein
MKRSTSIEASPSLSASSYAYSNMPACLGYPPIEGEKDPRMIEDAKKRV